MGHTFRRWLGRLQGLGYVVDYRVLDASLYGAPTRRRRLFMVARCDGRLIRWPEPTHGAGLFVKPVRTAAECIDWSLPCPSIFERKRPLAEKTLWRIAQGIRRFVLESPAPFIVKFRHDSEGSAIDQPMPTVTAGGQPRPHRPATGNPLGLVVPSLVEMNHSNAPHGADEPLGTVTTQHNRFNLVAPTLIQTSWGEREGQRPRYLDLHQPLGTVVAGGQKHALVAAFLAKHFGGVVGHGLERPVGAVTAKDHHSLAAATLLRFNHDDNGVPLDSPMPTVTGGALHIAEVRAFLTAFYGTDGTAGKGQRVDSPMRTLTAKHRLGLVTVEGADYQIVDIGMRMLEPHELLRAQFGRFAEAYDMSAATTKAAKVRLIGNSVCPEIAEAIVRANLPADAGEMVA
jgi:DNA (cytosine-5)-methyltransferase 1